MPHLEEFSIYSNKFFHNFHLSKSSFNCPRLWGSGLAQRLHLALTNNHSLTLTFQLGESYPPTGNLIDLGDDGMVQAPGSLPPINTQMKNISK